MNNPAAPRTKPKARPLTARQVAQEALISVLDRRAGGLEDVLLTHQGWQKLEPRDKGFARVLAATVLRRLGEIDTVLSRCLQQKLAPKEQQARAALRLGVAQLLHLGTPPHAAVSDTVDLAPDHMRKLVNAILRRVDREREVMTHGLDAARLSLPSWLWDSWRRVWGEPATRAMAEALLGEPPLDISAKTSPADWVEPLDAALLPTGTLRRWAGGDVATLAGYDQGAWWVQDLAAALPARLLGDLTGKQIVDLCAAPGGKTAQLAAAGAEVTALDRSAARMERLKQNLARLGLRANLAVADGADWLPARPVDAVLLDAPCSATGTIRRHPEIRWTKQPADIVSLTATQDRLLRGAVRMLKPGGTLIYCTCSLQPEEGEHRIAALLAEDSRLSRQPVTAREIGGLVALISPQGDLRCLPHHLAELGGLDGFYAARLVLQG